MQAYGDELDEFVSTPREILMKVVEDIVPLLAKSMDSYDLQTLEEKVIIRGLRMYRIGRQLAPMQKEPLHPEYSCICILLFAQKAYSFVPLAICKFCNQTSWLL